MKSMKLYDQAERIHNELRALGIADDAALSVDDLTPFDQYHYHGTEAVEETIAALHPGPESRLLEVGSGIGGPARYLASRTGCHVTALELQPDLHAIGTQLSARCSLSSRVDHRQGDILDSPFDDAGFDALVSFLVFLHIEDRERLFASCRRSLKKDGLIFIEDFSKRAEPSPGQWADLRHKVQCPYLPTPQAYREQLVEAGFKPLSFIDMSGPWSAYTRERYEAFRAARDSHRRRAIRSRDIGGLAYRRVQGLLNGLNDLVCRLVENANVLSSHLSVATWSQIELDLLPFGKTRQARLLHRRDMDESIGVSILTRDEAIALLRVEPLNGAFQHQLTPVLGHGGGSINPRNQQTV
jgi:cyclopropane fatty-acyl-phospholipid synthase-like methyltransferase